MDKRTLEQHYRKFQKVSARWYEITTENMVYFDTSHTGEPFRRIALTHDKAVFEEATALLVKWREFADTCEAAATDGLDVNILTPEFAPVPFILEDFTKSTNIISRSAVIVRTLTREFILKKYDTIIKHSKSSPIFASIAGALTEERRIYADDPEGTLYRARKGGFSDTIVENSLNGEMNFDRYRVGTHGVLVFAHQPDTVLPVRDRKKKRDSLTAYDGVTPLPCSPLADHQLYRMSELEAAQTSFIAVARLERVVEMRKTQFNKRAKMVLASARAKNNPALEAVIQTRIKTAHQALDTLEEMDRKVLQNMRTSGDDLSGLKISEARKRYGGDVELEYGRTFGKVMAGTRLR